MIKLEFFGIWQNIKISRLSIFTVTTWDKCKSTRYTYMLKLTVFDRNGNLNVIAKTYTAQFSLFTKSNHLSLYVLFLDNWWFKIPPKMFDVKRCNKRNSFWNYIDYIICRDASNRWLIGWIHQCQLKLLNF